MSKLWVQGDVEDNNNNDESDQVEADNYNNTQEDSIFNEATHWKKIELLGCEDH